MTRNLWSVNGLATELQRDRRTIAEALSAVPPDGQTHGRPAWFMTTAFAALSVASGNLDPAQERARKDRALAISAEIKNDIATGKVVPIDVTVQAWSSILSAARSRLLAIPTKAAARVPGNVQRLVHDFVEEEVIFALTELAETDVVPEDRAPSQEAA